MRGRWPDMQSLMRSRYNKLASLDPLQHAGSILFSPMTSHLPIQHFAVQGGVGIKQDNYNQPPRVSIQQAEEPCPPRLDFRNTMGLSGGVPDSKQPSLITTTNRRQGSA